MELWKGKERKGRIGNRIMKLILKGNPAYIKRMYAHLRKEHPSVRRRLKIKK